MSLFTIWPLFPSIFLQYEMFAAFQQAVSAATIQSVDNFTINIFLWGGFASATFLWEHATEHSTSVSYLNYVRHPMCCIKDDQETESYLI